MIGEIHGYGQSPVCICLQKSQEHRVLVDRVGLGFREDKELVLWTAHEVCVCGLGGCSAAEALLFVRTSIVGPW